MFKELKKFAKDTPIHVTMSEELQKSFAYAYSENTVVYYELDGNIDVYNDLILLNANDFNDIDDCIHTGKVIVDENPFAFELHVEKNDKIHFIPIKRKVVSVNTFVKSLAPFTKFYDIDNIHKEYRGIHISNGNMFATNSYVMRIIKSSIFDKQVNMVIDFNPIVDFIDIDTKKIKSTGMSLFAKKTNNDVTISTYNTKDDSILFLEYKGLSFINHSICKSELDFKYVDESSENLDSTIKVYKNDLYKVLNDLLGQSIKIPNKVKNAFVFEQIKEKLLVYPYVKFTNDRNVVKTINAQSNIDSRLVTNGENLLNILKLMTDEIVELQHNKESKICKITSKNSKEDYYIIFNV